MAEPRLRLGILGAARNVPFSVMQPVSTNADLSAKIEVVGLASLEHKEAETCAKHWGIARAYHSFDELLDDPQVHAVYNVLPTAVRAHWTVRALLKGKHVLSETPVGCNAQEALLLQRAAEDAGRVLVEGTHPTHHPVAKRVKQMLGEGKIGALQRIDLDLPIGFSLLGKLVCSSTGALMGLGCHGVAIARTLVGEEWQVVRAVAKRSLEHPEVDSTMACDLTTLSGVEAHLSCSIAAEGSKLPSTFTLSGSGGVIRVKQWFRQGKSSNEIVLEQYVASGERWVERLDNIESRDTFYFQLMAFVDEVWEQSKSQGMGLPWEYVTGKGPADAARNVALIDAIYCAAGMRPRPTTAPPPAPYEHIGAARL